jgi:hypothetical protein
VREGLEGLLAGGHCLTERGTVVGPGTRLAAVGYSFAPHLPPQGVIRQAFDLLDQPVGTQLLDGLDNSRVQRASLFLEETPIGHLLREGMLEGVDQLRE